MGAVWEGVEDEDATAVGYRVRDLLEAVDWFEEVSAVVVLLDSASVAICEV